ncbi:hypothetical protein F511_21618 [Dorcoceras hygrometricum]|uniref:Uncharacterized protein n=1 Tax=Dorcoceras hygrometricum TaxID=472368 RepID=A0A2Z7D5P3_9LAMI|nr:hypothetical protein F511_21618 [Dorcoceras hygrometricum]
MAGSQPAGPPLGPSGSLGPNHSSQHVLNGSDGARKVAACVPHVARNMVRSWLDQLAEPSPLFIHPWTTIEPPRLTPEPHEPSMTEAQEEEPNMH